jgi:hypothetical protein
MAECENTGSRARARDLFLGVKMHAGGEQQGATSHSTIIIKIQTSARRRRRRCWLGAPFIYQITHLALTRGAQHTGRQAGRQRVMKLELTLTLLQHRH